jgi:hypothetical protein
MYALLLLALAVSFGFNYMYVEPTLSLLHKESRTPRTLLTLACTTSTAAYVDSANDSVPIVKIEGSEEYQRYMRQLASDSQDRV